MPAETAPYIERYRWTRTITLSIAADLVFVALVVFVPTPAIIRIPCIAVFGWFAAYSVAGVLSGKVALRVDDGAVTLGGGPFRYAATTRFHRWEDIERITLWERHIPMEIWRWTPFVLGPIRYIGLRRRPSAPQITAAGTGRADWPAHGAPVGGIAAGAARNITAFRVDLERLTQSVAAFAPDVVVESGPAVGKPQPRSRAAG
jgi:hypothetical protein